MENISQPGTFWIVSQATTLAHDADLLNFTILSNYFFVISFIVTVGFAINYKLRLQSQSHAGHAGLSEDYDHATLWSVIQSFRPLLLCFVIFIWVFRSFLTQELTSPDVLDVSASFDQSTWNFSYHDKGLNLFQLFVPIGRTTKVVIHTGDLAHRDAISSRNVVGLDWSVISDTNATPQATVWLDTQLSGMHVVYCDGECTALSNLLSQVRILSVEDFSKERRKIHQPVNKRSLEEWGEELSSEHNCEACHSLEEDGQLIGPSLWGIYGREGVTESGEKYIANESYLRESLVNPQAKIVRGYPASMPSFKDELVGQKLEALIAFMKTLK
jgi:cytochrome c oxidase subunit 2